eukprot:gb/GECG01015563.1/.p1 GENE.gb/GECG01015563.1/~~gb/GECG01015563.1/.p1  ORF type:complete len:147 (+),score=17.26 gb/GECG01015563.1/:1-441(+)
MGESSIIDRKTQARCFASGLQGFLLGSGYTAFALTESLIRRKPQHAETPPPTVGVTFRMVAKEAVWTGINTSALVVAYVGGSGVVETLRDGYTNDPWNTVAGTMTASLILFRGAPLKSLVKNSLLVGASTYALKWLYLKRVSKVKR